MKVVIDFSTYLNNNEYVIKEFCMYYVFTSEVIRDCLIVTKSPENLTSEDNQDYEEYYVEYGIPPEDDRFCDINILRNKIIGTLDVNQKIYVRDKIQAELFTEFAGLHYNNIKSLDEMGFDVAPLKQTNCPYHDNPKQNYCAGDNALIMVNWLLEEKLIDVTLRYNMQAIINFNGYYNSDNHRFVIKELSVYGIDAEGSIAYHESYVTKPPHHIIHLTDTIDNYNEFSYNNYGIKWTDGFYESSRINRRLNEVLRKASVKFIYVKNLNYKLILSTILENFSTYSFISLDDYYYVEKSFPHIECPFHTHPNAEKNKCVDVEAKSMLDYIVESKLYQR